MNPTERLLFGAGLHGKTTLESDWYGEDKWHLRITMQSWGINPITKERYENVRVFESPVTNYDDAVKDLNQQLNKHSWDTHILCQARNILRDIQ